VTVCWVLVLTGLTTLGKGVPRGWCDPAAQHTRFREDCDPATSRDGLDGGDRCSARDTTDQGLSRTEIRVCVFAAALLIAASGQGGGAGPPRDNYPSCFSVLSAASQHATAHRQVKQHDVGPVDKNAPSRRDNGESAHSFTDMPVTERYWRAQTSVNPSVPRVISSRTRGLYTGRRGQRLLATVPNANHGARGRERLGAS
jgi:hypothetical protein